MVLAPNKPTDYREDSSLLFILGQLRTLFNSWKTSAGYLSNRLGKRYSLLLKAVSSYFCKLAKVAFENF